MKKISLRVWVGVISLSLFAACLAIWAIPHWQANSISGLNDKERAEREQLLRGTFVSGFGTLATVAVGVLLYLNFRVANKNVQMAEQRLELDAKRVAKDSDRAASLLITERFSKAVEQLGNENIHVRLGSIFALEQVAQNSPGDHWTIMEVLTSYIQERCPTLDLQEDVQAEEPKFRPIAKDVQAVLTVIGRRNVANDPDNMRLDISNANLSDANLSNANLSNANLSNANLSNVNLSNANLSNANLSGINFSGAILSGANLSGANLSGANLSVANLIGANLNGANLIYANLSGTYLSGASFRGAYLRDAYLSGAVLSNPEQVQQAVNWEKADLDEDLKTLLGLSRQSEENQNQPPSW